MFTGLLQKFSYLISKTGIIILILISYPSYASNEPLLNGSTDNQITHPVQARIFIHAPDGLNNDNTWLGIVLEHNPSWHTYWKNPGYTGQATSVELNLPDGVYASDIYWPAPHSFEFEGLISYGYSKTVLLPIKLSFSKDFNLQQNLDINAQVNWLACSTVCIPGSATLQTKLTNTTNPAQINLLFDHNINNLPQLIASHPDNNFSLTNESPPKLNIALANLPDELNQFDIYIENTDLIDYQQQWQQQWLDNKWQASINFNDIRHDNKPLSEISLILVNQQTNKSYQAIVPLNGAWIKLTSAPELTENTVANDATTVLNNQGLNIFLALLAAFVGGILLNCMPCVFPILAIKVFSIINQQQTKQLRQQAIIYALGCLCTFLTLASIILILRQTSNAIGWGFQLQSPITISILISLMSIIGLNLAGLFEFNSILPNKVSKLTSNNANVNAFLSGILSVIIASPCTAPFMGIAIGLTLVVPAYQVWLIFAIMAIGMALPYVAICYIPRLSNLLPKPGAWMLTLKQLLAFPMFATAIWLLWILGQQVDASAIITMLVVVLALIFLIWSLTLTGKSKLVLATIAIITLLLSYSWHSSHLKQQLLSANQTTSKTTTNHDLWQPWSQQLQQQYLEQGYTVLVDYTAAWCITCQYNKKAVLDNPEVKTTFANNKVKTLRADWTSQNTEITQALHRYGRNGVPTYVLIQPNKIAKILPEILTKSGLINELN